MSLPRPLRWPASHPLQKGLVLWLPMDERSGARALDRSGAGNHGTISGATWAAAAGRRGSALSFDGGDSVSLASFTISRLAGALALWFRSNTNFTANYSNQGIIMGKTADKFKSYLALIGGSGTTYTLRGETDTNGENYIATSSTVTKNAWHHVLCSFKDGDATSYVDGAQADTKAGLTNDVTMNVLGLAEASVAYVGLVAGVRRWTRPVEAAEAKRLYESELMLTRW